MTRQSTSAVSHRLFRSPHAKRPPRGRLRSSRLVGSDHRAWHRLWTDNGQRRRVGSYQEVGTNRSTFRCYFTMGKIRGTLWMRSHISVHRATTKYFCNSFVSTTNIEKEGLPRDRTPDLGAGGLRFKSGRPDQNILRIFCSLSRALFTQDIPVEFS
jgi:hypothetical protein